MREGLSIVMRDVIMMIESTKKIENVARFIDCIIVLLFLFAFKSTIFELFPNIIFILTIFFPFLPFQ